ncbi:unnamed protein product [Phyllotreta striolata]|uniref:Uncharacterized protein n=1 Tax=Phyllotreta striolata TaxID=444603 RepID=A0A9N9XUJ0_PHYSR|nr:unnamed protein product [Phyllotreta striolata]
MISFFPVEKYRRPFIKINLISDVACGARKTSRGETEVGKGDGPSPHGRDSILPLSKMGSNFAFFAGVFASFAAGVLALQCYQCGMYNDGVGSITPCLNQTLMKLIECPKADHKFCIGN